jgi:DNA-binding transcriptional LysR family regulator
MPKRRSPGPHMNIRQLDAFRAVVLTGTVSAAAARMAVSQPAVSRLIADLERAVGFPLFERRNRRLHIRPEGEILYREVERSFVGVEKIAERAQEIRDYRTGHLRIAGMPAMSLGLLPKVVQGFRRVHPNVTVSVQIRSSQKVAEFVSAQQFDIGFAALPINQPGVAVDHFEPLPCVCVLPRGHRLAKRKTITPEMLSGESFISLGADSMLRYRVDQVFQAAGVARDMHIDTTISANALLLSSLGLGVSIIDPFTPLAFPSAEVAVRPFTPVVPYEFATVFPMQTTRSRVAEAFLEIFQSEVREFAAAMAR